MSKVLASLAVVLMFAAVASAQPWLDATDLTGMTPGGGPVWELPANTVTWIYVYGHSNANPVESVSGDYQILDPTGNTGVTPTITGFGTTGTALAGYDSDWSMIVSPTLLAISCGHFGAYSGLPGGALANPTGAPVYAIEIDTTGCVISDWWTIDISTAVYFGAMDMSTPVSIALGSTLTNGQIHIIPEPATLSLLAIGSLALLRRKR